MLQEVALASGIRSAQERRRGARVRIGRLPLALACAGVETTLALTAAGIPIALLAGSSPQSLIAQMPVMAAAAALYMLQSAESALSFLKGSTSLRGSIFAALRAWAFAFCVATTAFALSQGLNAEIRAGLFAGFGLGLLLLGALRAGIYAMLRERLRAGRIEHARVVLVGRRADIARFTADWKMWSEGYGVADRLVLQGTETADNLRQKLVAFVGDWINKGVDRVVLVGDRDGLDRLSTAAVALRRFSVDVLCAPARPNAVTPVLDLVPLGEAAALQVMKKPLSTSDVVLKRLFDIAAASVGLVLLAPLFAIVAVLIRLESPGPALFRQERRGFNGRIFPIFKFRSMRVTESGHTMKQATRGDARVTRIGRFIRATSIDELPQLLNVLLGDMSLVGPRPHPVNMDAALESQLAEYAHRQRLKPGITGWAQVNGYRGETRTREQILGRVRHDLYYVDNWSIVLDIWIVILTVFSRRARQNAY